MNTLDQLNDRLSEELSQREIPQQFSSSFGWQVIIGTLIGQLVVCLYNRWTAEEVQRAIPSMLESTYRPVPALRRAILRKLIRRSLKLCKVEEVDRVTVDEIMYGMLTVGSALTFTEMKFVVEKSLTTGDS